MQFMHLPMAGHSLTSAKRESHIQQWDDAGWHTCQPLNTAEADTTGREVECAELGACFGRTLAILGVISRVVQLARLIWQPVLCHVVDCAGERQYLNRCIISAPSLMQIRQAQP